MATRRLSPPAILLHWLVFLLFLVALFCIEYREFVPSGDPLRRSLRSTHVLVGQLIWLASLMRLFVRLRFPPLPVSSAAAAAPWWMSWGANGVHLLLYGIMFLQPVIGILSMQAGDKDVVFFNWILPRLIDSNPELHFTLKDAHKIVATAFYLLFAMHMVGALVHHFVVKDGTLQRMFRLRGTL